MRVEQPFALQVNFWYQSLAVKTHFPETNFFHCLELFPQICSYEGEHMSYHSHLTKEHTQVATFEIGTVLHFHCLFLW